MCGVVINFFFCGLPLRTEALVKEILTIVIYFILVVDKRFTYHLI